MAKEKPIDVYIFGAGASRAELPQMPLMNDFFAILAKQANYTEDNLWRCLALLDYLRLFKNRHIECENLAAQVWILRGQKQKTILLKKKVGEYLESFQQRMEDPLLAENLEEVFERAVVAPITYMQSPRHRLLAAINRLFELLINEKGCSFPVFSEFIKKVIRKKGRKAVFISFNYDLILDRVLFDLSNWDPKIGYGYEFEDVITVALSTKHLISKGKQKSDLVLLKPHGSLSWRYETNLGYEGFRKYLTVDEKGFPTQERYYAKHYKKDWKKFNILVVPPISAKSFSQPILYETRRLVKQSLQLARDITIIGWSLPETDVDMKNMIQRIFDDVDLRTQQLQKLTIVDYNNDKRNFLRLQALFMAKNNTVHNRGFEHFVFSSLK